MCTTCQHGYDTCPLDYLEELAKRPGGAGADGDADGWDVYGNSGGAEPKQLHGEGKSLADAVEDAVEEQ